MASMPSTTSTKGVSCSVAGAGKVTLIDSNCPASRVGRCVDCEGGRIAQIFSDCAITKYFSRATARRPCGRQTIAAVESLYSCYCIATSTHSSPAELPWTSRNTGRPPTVASPVAHDSRLAGRPVSRHLQRRQCWQAEWRCSSVVRCCLLACGSYIQWSTFVSYRIVSLMAVSCHH